MCLFLTVFSPSVNVSISMSLSIPVSLSVSVSLPFHHPQTSFLLGSSSIQSVFLFSYKNFPLSQDVSAHSHIPSASVFSAHAPTPPLLLILSKDASAPSHTLIHSVYLSNFLTFFISLSLSLPQDSGAVLSPASTEHHR